MSHFTEIGINKIHANYYHNAISLRLGAEHPAHVLKLSTITNSHIFLSLNQEDARLFQGEQGADYTYSYFRVTIAKIETNPTTNSQNGKQALSFLDCKFSSDRNTFFEFNLDKGDYVVLIQPYLYNNLAKICSFSIYSSNYGAHLQEIKDVRSKGYILDPRDFFERIEVEIWKNYTKTNLNLFTPKGTQSLKEINSSVYHHSLESKYSDFGLFIDAFVNVSPASYYQKWIIQDDQVKFIYFSPKNSSKKGLRICSQAKK